VFPVLRALWGRRRRSSAEYVAKEEFGDLLLEGLRRAATNPTQSDVKTCAVIISRSPESQGGTTSTSCSSGGPTSCPSKRYGCWPLSTLRTPDPLARNPGAILQKGPPDVRVGA